MRGAAHWYQRNVIIKRIRRQWQCPRTMVPIGGLGTLATTSGSCHVSGVRDGDIDIRFRITKQMIWAHQKTIDIRLQLSM